MKRWRLVEPHGNLGPELLAHFPPELHTAVAEEINYAANYEHREKPTLQFPHLFLYARQLLIEPSQTLKDTVKQTPFTVLVGPSGSGRNTLVDYLSQRYPDIYAKSLSVTTRDKRLDRGVMETEGASYYHRTPQTVLTSILGGEFLEWEIIHGQQVSGLHISSFSGIPEGKIGINDTELEGARALHDLDGRKSIFVVPDNFETWVSLRIGTCSEAEKVARLSSSLNEMKAAIDSNHFEYFVNELCSDIPGSESYANSRTDNGERLHSLVLHMNGRRMSKENAMRHTSNTARAKALLILHCARIERALGLPVG